MGHIVSGEREKIKEFIPQKDYDFYIKFLAKDFDSFKTELGNLKNYKIQGTAALPWNKNNYRTNVILNFERGYNRFIFGLAKRTTF